MGFEEYLYDTLAVPVDITGFDIRLMPYLKTQNGTSNTETWGNKTFSIPKLQAVLEAPSPSH